jgi:hypothetical protein
MKQNRNSKSGMQEEENYFFIVQTNYDFLLRGITKIQQLLLSFLYV